MVKDIKRNTPEANHLSEQKTLDYDLQVQTQGLQGRGHLVVISVTGYYTGSSRS